MVLGISFLQIYIDTDFAVIFLVFRESEGTFHFGHYWREVDDLHDVIQHFSGTNHTVSAILGHSKGALVLSDDHCVKFHHNKIEGKNLVINLNP